MRRPRRPLPRITHAGDIVRRLGIALVVLTITVTIAHAALVFDRERQAQVAMLEAWTTQGVVQLADIGRTRRAASTTSWESTAGPLIEEFRRWAWGALQQDGVVASALLDEQGRVIASAPRDHGMEPQAFEVGEAGQVRSRTITLSSGDCAIWQVYGATQRDGSEVSRVGLVMLANPRPSPVDAARSSLPLGAVALGASLIVLLLSSRWLTTCVRRPLGALVDAAGDTKELPIPDWITERGDEVGLLARVLDSLGAVARRSADQVDRLERNMNSRVKDQTRQINLMLQRAERDKWQDALTRLGNRRLLDDRLGDLFDGQRRTGEDLSLVMFDLDNFKTLNDTKGHSAGDNILRFVGDLLLSTLRPADLAIRYGGDEFAVVLMDTAPDQAAVLSERVIRLFQQRAAVLKVQPPVSMSAGIASLLRDGPTSAQELLDLADQALYKAKASGKNRLCLAP